MSGSSVKRSGLSKYTTICDIFWGTKIPVSNTNLSEGTVQGTEKWWSPKTGGLLTQVNYGSKCILGGVCKGGVLTQVVLSSTVHFCDLYKDNIYKMSIRTYKLVIHISRLSVSL